jgi:hypothetical protein
MTNNITLAGGAPITYGGPNTLCTTDTGPQGNVCQFMNVIYDMGEMCAHKAYEYMGFAILTCSK